jgi:hypothetical protein
MNKEATPMLPEDLFTAPAEPHLVGTSFEERLP